MWLIPRWGPYREVGGGVENSERGRIYSPYIIFSLFPTKNQLLSLRG